MDTKIIKDYNGINNNNGGVKKMIDIEKKIGDLGLSLEKRRVIMNKNEKIIFTIEVRNNKLQFNESGRYNRIFTSIVEIDETSEFYEYLQDYEDLDIATLHQIYTEKINRNKIKL